VRRPSGSHRPLSVAPVGGDAGGDREAADQPSDQPQQQHDQRVHVTAGGWVRLGSDGDHGGRAEVALAGPDLLDRGLGARGLGGLDVAEQPVVLVLGGPGRRPGPRDGGAAG
jgi:hypothetical protein